MSKDLSPAELALQIHAGHRVHMVDVRTPREYSACHIRGARNIPLDTIEDRLPGVGTDEAIVLICDVGIRSLTACARLADRYPYLSNLRGGMEAWVGGGHPSEAAPKLSLGPDRQTHIVAGLMIWAGITLSILYSPWWIALSAMPGFGMLLHGSTGICPMTLLLERMPWNRPGTCPGRLQNSLSGSS